MKKRAAESVADVLKKVRILLVSESCELTGSLFANGGVGVPRAGEIPAKTEALLEGKYHDDGTRVCIRYKESELTGMEGSTTSVSFQKNDPGVISMLRDGAVKTALIFEQGQRHLCVYQTPIMPFEVGVYTKKVHNGIEKEGVLEMDYTVEIRGAQAERTKFQMRVLPYFDKPGQK